MTDRTELERQIAELQAQLAAMPDVDPLLVEAREIVIDTTPQPQRNFEIRKAEIRRGWKDDGFCVQIALAALRRGMELAKPELTREQLGDAIVKVFAEGERGFAQVTPNNITALHAALTEATLSRVPAAAWPGEMRRYPDSGLGEPVREYENLAANALKAHMTGGAAKPEPQWIDWHGGECPVPAGTLVEVRFKTGHVATETNPETLDWQVTWVGYSIIAYRILGGAA